MGMGWHTLAHESSELTSKRPCKCGKHLFHTFYIASIKFIAKKKAQVNYILQTCDTYQLPYLIIKSFD